MSWRRPMEDDQLSPAEQAEMNTYLTSVIASVEQAGGAIPVDGPLDLPETPGLYEVYAINNGSVNGVPLVKGDAALFRLIDTQWSFMIVGGAPMWQNGPIVPAVRDTFTAPDGTLFAGRVTEKGALTWAVDSPTSPISGTVATGIPSIRNERLQKPTGDTDGRAAQLSLAPATRVELSADYVVGNGRVHLGIMGAFNGPRIACWFDSTQGIKLYRWNSTGMSDATQLGATVTGQPLTGRIALGFDPVSTAYVAIDGIKVIAVTASSLGLGSRCAIALGVGDSQSLDNIEVRYL